MNLLTLWLRTFSNDCNFRVRFNTLDKEWYAEDWEEKSKVLFPIKPPEFYIKGVSLGAMEEELKSTYVELIMDNGGCRQPHEFILSSIRLIRDKYFLSFTQAYANWPVSRIVVFDEFNQIIRNDFKDVYKLSWQDFEDEKYQPKKRLTLT